MFLLDVGFQDDSGVGVVEFGGFGTGGEVGGYEVVKWEADWEGGRVSAIRNGNDLKTRGKDGRGPTGHAELLCWSHYELRSARGMRARGHSPPMDVRFAFSSSTSQSINGISPSARHSRMIEACRDTR